MEEEVPRNIKSNQVPDEKGTYWEQYTIPGTVASTDKLLIYYSTIARLDYGCVDLIRVKLRD